MHRARVLQRRTIRTKSAMHYRMHIFVRMLLLGIPIFLVIIVAFRLFNMRLQSLLDRELLQRNRQRTVGCAQLIEAQIESDRARLNTFASMLAMHTIGEMQNLIRGTDFTLKAGTHFSGYRFVVEEQTIMHKSSFRLADGQDVELSLDIPAETYEPLLVLSHDEGDDVQIFWVDKSGTIFWHIANGVEVTSSENLHTLFPAWNGTFEDAFIRIDQSTYLNFAQIGSEYGWFILQSRDGLFEQASLTVLRASISMAMLVLLLLSTLLFYVLYKEQLYEESLMHLAFRDELTNLPNKNHFVKESSALLERSSALYALIIFDIGKFKLINDHFGYAFGDSLLMHFAKVLPRYTPKDGVCARLSGDKFIMLCSYRDKETLEKRIDVITEELKRFSFPGASLFKLDILVGISLLKGDEMPVPAAIDKALFALSALKEQQVVGRLYYDEVLRSHLLEESEIEKVYFEAVMGGQFFIMLQPKYSLKTGRLYGAEALVRWNHPTKGLLGPSQFIPLLEKHNLLAGLDMFVLENVCTLLKRWEAQGLPLFPISVNQSRSYLFNTHYEQTLVELIDRFSVPHHLIEFELTESLFLHDAKHLCQVLSSLRAHSFLVSLDDFGSGYSSLTMLKDVPIDAIKLDQGFIRGTDEQQRGKLVVKSIISMAHALGITTVAEGVETEEQAQMLTQLGCDVVQGYYFSMPLETARYEALLVEEAGFSNP